MGAFDSTGRGYIFEEYMITIFLRSVMCWIVGVGERDLR